MNMKEFFCKYNFNFAIDIEKTISGILSDMEKGLKGEKSYQDMFNTFIKDENKSVKNEKVIVIDAGGTNFRSCLVSFDGDGKAMISDMEKTFMPGSDRPYSKSEFFEKVAENLEHLKNKASKIGFCFSYPMEITPDGDGIPGVLSKEIKVSELTGCHIGKELKSALEKKGWNKIEKIQLLNDTASALLAGNLVEGNYSSKIGFILGTGMNGAYIEGNTIIDCETGKFSGIETSDFDKMMDEKTAFPGSFLIEKSCSGGYMPLVLKEIFDCAIKEGIFSEKLGFFIKEKGTFDLKEMDFADETFKDFPEDLPKIEEIYCRLVERSGRYACAILASDAIKCGQGKDKEKPVLMVCNGSTFYKTKNLKKIVEENLDKVLSKRGIFHKIVQVEDDITLGTAIAAV